MKDARIFKAERERESNRVGKKKSLREKEHKRCLEEEIVDTPCKINVNTVVKKHLIKNYLF